MGLLRILLVLAFAAVVVAQVAAVPGTLAHLADQSPALAPLQGPVLAIAVLGLACVEVVIVCTWQLLTLVKHDRIFSDRSLVWVDGIVWAIVVAWFLLLGGFVYIGLNVGFGPGLPALVVLMLLAGAVLGLLIVVMRALLRQATTLRADMEAVI